MWQERDRHVHSGERPFGRLQQTIHVTTSNELIKHSRIHSWEKQVYKWRGVLSVCKSEQSTWQISHTSVQFVTKVSAAPTTCRDIGVFIIATEDRISVLTVGSCLRQTWCWRIMFVFTLVQSRTRVDTVQNVSRGLTNSRHICWRRTMKVRGWHVTCVRRNSVTMATLISMYVDTKVWSRMFAVVVQSVSMKRRIWNLIRWHIRTTDNFVVVYVVKISNVKLPL